jgi:hypothetical protein
MTNREDAAGDGGVGEGGRGEGGDGSGGRSMTNPVLMTEPVGIKNNNQPMVVVTVSGGMRTWRAIEQCVREARQEGEDGGGGRSMTKPTTEEEEQRHAATTNKQQSMATAKEARGKQAVRQSKDN